MMVACFQRPKQESESSTLHEHGSSMSLGFWVFRDKASRAVVGYGGFRYFEDDREQFKDQIELCYILDEPFWGQGYASELVVTMVQTGLDHGFTSMMATILPDNIASQCVVEKAGLSYAFDASFDIFCIESMF